MNDNIYLRDDYLKAAFKMFDTDGSGKIDSTEVVALLSGDDLTNLISKEAIDVALQEIDQNGDGEIDFDEFMQMMKRAAEVDQVSAWPKQPSWAKHSELSKSFTGYW